MRRELLEAVEGFKAGGRENFEPDDCIDDLLTDQRPRKQQCKTPETLKKQLEESFLSPPTSFDSSWLNRLQQ